MRPFVDTNVLVYAHDEDEPEKRQVALELLGQIGGHMVISAQVLAEFWVTVTRKLAHPLSPEVAAAQLADLVPAANVTTDADLVSEAAALSMANQFSLWDAMILRAAVRGGCRCPVQRRSAGRVRARWRAGPQPIRRAMTTLHLAVTTMW